MFTRGKIKRLLAALSLIAMAGFPPVAMAMPIEGGVTRVLVTPPVGVSQAYPTALGPTDASSGGYDFAASAVPTSAQSGSEFEWGDAGIGAAGMAALMGAGAAASVSVRRRRVRRVIAG